MALGVVIALIFGTIEFSRVLMVHHVITNAVREATRHAVVPYAADADVEAIVTKYADSAGISGHTTEIKVNGSDQISEEIVSGKFYQALKLAQRLIDYEQEVISGVN